jgi:hypothetical protein
MLRGAAGFVRFRRIDFGGGRAVIADLFEQCEIVVELCVIQTELATAVVAAVFSTGKASSLKGNS